MMGFLNRLLCRSAESGGGSAYAAAMDESGDLLNQMREFSTSTDAVRGVIATLWLQRHNIPLVATVHEAVTEMKTPLLGYTEAHAPPEKKKL
jgi:hypothetical protein